MSSKNLWELTPEELRATLDASMKQLESEFLQADYDCAWLLARNMTLIDSRELAIEAKVPPKDDD